MEVMRLDDAPVMRQLSAIGSEASMDPQVGGMCRVITLPKAWG